MTHLGKAGVEQEAVHLAGKTALAVCCGLKLQRGRYQMFGCALPSPRRTDRTEQSGNPCLEAKQHTLVQLPAQQSIFPPGEPAVGRGSCPELRLQTFDTPESTEASANRVIFFIFYNQLKRQQITNPILARPTLLILAVGIRKTLK